MEDLISIVVPIYKVEKYLKRCVDSILAQTYKNLEIILVDDGSPDNCGAICDEYQKQDNRIQVIHKENGGLSDARNKGIDIAKGKYIAFVDSDDFIHPKFIETLYNLCIENNCEIAQVDFKRVYNDHIAVVPEEKVVQVYTTQEFLYHLYSKDYVKMIVAWNKLYKKELFEQIRYPFGKLHEDEATTYRLVYEAKKIAISNQPLYNYFFEESSITNKKYNEKRLDILEIQKQRAEFFKEKREQVIYELSMKQYCLTLMNAYINSKRYLPNTKQRQKEMRKEFKQIAKEVLHYEHVKLKSKVAIVVAYAMPRIYGRLWVR